MDAHQSDLFTTLSPAAQAWCEDQFCRLFDRFGPDERAIAKGMCALTFPHGLAKLQGLPHDPLAAEVSSAFQRAGIEIMIRQAVAIDRLLPGASDEVKDAYLDLIADEEA